MTGQLCVSFPTVQVHWFSGGWVPHEFQCCYLDHFTGPRLQVLKVMVLQSCELLEWWWELRNRKRQFPTDPQGKMHSSSRPSFKMVVCCSSLGHRGGVVCNVGFYSGAMQSLYLQATLQILYRLNLGSVTVSPLARGAGICGGNGDQWDVHLTFSHKKKSLMGFSRSWWGTYCGRDRMPCSLLCGAILGFCSPQGLCHASGTLQPTFSITPAKI